MTADHSDRVPFVATRAAMPYDRIGPLPVRVLLADVRSLYNVGAFFRTADAVGIDRLALAGITARPPHAGIEKTALGADRSVEWEAVDDTAGWLEGLRGAGWQLAAIETTPHALDLFDWQPAFPVCVVFGHEVDGVAPGILARVDTAVRVPMRGTKHSLNVATAGGVVLYELLRKYRDARRRARPLDGR